MSGTRLKRLGLAEASFSRAEAARGRMGWGEAEMASYLGVSVRVYRSRRVRGRLRGAESPKLEFLELTLELGERVLGSADAGCEWLQRPLPALGGARPVDHMISIEGYEAVRHALLRAEHGVIG